MNYSGQIGDSGWTCADPTPTLVWSLCILVICFATYFVNGTIVSTNLIRTLVCPPIFCPVHVGYSKLKKQTSNNL